MRLLGPASEVAVTYERLVSELLDGDNMSAYVRFRGGGSADVSASLGHSFISHLAVFGSNGWIEVRHKADFESPDGWVVTKGLKGQPITVEQVNVKKLRPGDRVVGECGARLPDRIHHFGFPLDGADREFLTAKPEWLHRLPDGVSDKQAALIEPFTCGLYTVNRMGGTNASETVVLAREEGQVAMVRINIGRTIGSHLGNIQICNLTVWGCIGSPGVWPAAIRFLERTRLDLSPIQIRDFPLSEAVKAFELGKQSDKCLKVTLPNT